VNAISAGARTVAVRRAMATLVPQFTTDRMVKEYTTKYYASH
jgi:glucan phosphorylase